MIKDIQKKREIGIVKKQDTLENRAKVVYLGLGSNLGNRRSNLEKAKFLLNKDNIQIISSSSFYETESWPNNNFPKYYNIVIKIKTTLSPFLLLNKIKIIEKKLGRKIEKRNHPRICDIDILDYSNKVLNLTFKKLQLQIPHPRLHCRDFVLLPLYEINKNWKHPKFNENIRKIILKNGFNNLRSIKII